MMPTINHIWSRWAVGMFAFLSITLVACGGGAEPTVAPVAATTAPASVEQPTNTPPPKATFTPAPTNTPLPAGIKSARDNITLVVVHEPTGLSTRIGTGASLLQGMTLSLRDPLTWQSGDDLRIVPTSATVGWKQIDIDTWQFDLRQGVKFQNGEPWNAHTAVPGMNYEGDINSPYGATTLTGPFTAEAVDDYTLNLNCGIPCPILPNTTFFLTVEAPEYIANTPDEQVVRTSVGFGPYKHTDWTPGVSVTMEAYEDYVPVGDHFEFQKPHIQTAKWVWSGETTVMAAMVKGGEADLAWDAGVDAIGLLPADMIRVGTSAETYALTTNTVWHPELKKKKVRQAMVHAINCQEMIEQLYGGYTTCRGNIIWPGIIGATESNTAPYKFDPQLAQRLLQEANYSPDNEMTIISRGTRIPKQREVSESLQAFWSNVGINAKFRIVEPAKRGDFARCAMAAATEEVLKNAGKEQDLNTATNADFQAAIDGGGASTCVSADLIGNQPSNESLDFGRQVRYYMSCSARSSMICDPSPGGIQDKIAPALAASGDERQQLLEVLADKFHEDVLFIPLFDLPVFFAVDPKVNWQPRLDPIVRVNGIWFSP
jgi:peptide/nickel transport system substrate-binding protein